MWRTAAISLAAILFIFVALHWRLTRPIDRLVRQSEALADGRLHDAAVWHRNDEVGRVGRSLENTRLALSKLVGELQNVNADLRSENAQRKQAEAEIARHAEVLETRVAERTQELSDANATLSITLNDLRQTQNDLIESKKLASLGRMVAGVAHELNTPIGNALTIGTTIGERVRELQEQSLAGQLKKSSLADFLTGTGEASEILERSLAKAAALVTRFKKLAESDSTDKLCTFDLADVASVASSSITHGLKGTAVSLLNQVPAGIFMTSYPDLMEQVLGNLLNNAVLHGFDNIPSGQITLLARTFNQSVEISINDNGNGIPEAIQNRIFDPMFTTRMGRGGMGLGLSVVHNIVTRKLGGRIQVHAVQPHGASFVVTVPLVAPPPISED